MAVVPIISQSWDTTSYVNPTRMNNIETNISTLSKATGIEYSSGVSVKDKIDSTLAKSSISNGTSKSFPCDKVILALFRYPNACIVLFEYNNYNVVSGSLPSGITINISNSVATVSNSAGYYIEAVLLGSNFN